MNGFKQTPFLAAVLASFALVSAATAQRLAPMGPLRYSNPEADRSRELLRRQLPSRQAVLRTPLEQRLARIGENEVAAAKALAPEGPQLAGLHRPAPAALMEQAAIEILPGGRQLWRAALRSEGAAGIRLHFTGFDIGTGRLWIHDGTGEENEIYGPYTGRGLFNDGDFWTDVILGESIVIEYEPASSMGPVELPPFKIAEISHILPESMPRLGKTGDRSAAASCNLDVTCHPEWAETAKAVAHIVFESGGSTLVCSGTLVNTRNNSGRPYFLTAQHCIANQTEARTVNAFWSYQTSTCNGAPPDRRNAQRTLGATYLAGTPVSSGDATLLLLNSVPSGVTFSGWDPNPLEPERKVAGIHHPNGDHKRISFGTSKPAARFSGRDLDQFAGAFWDGGGLTEGGSSGSGLFTGSLMLVGMLSHGPKANTPEQYCAILPFTDNYGRFSQFFPLVRDLLEDRTTTPTPPPPPPASGGALTSGQARSISLGPVTGARLFNGSSGFTINVPQGATRLDVTLRSTPPNADVDLYVRFGEDVALEGGRPVADFRSEGAAGDEQVSISGSQLRAGTYFIALGVFTTGVQIQSTLTATVTTGTAPPPPPPATGNQLTSGQARSFSLGPVTGATLFNGSNGFTISVPQGATRLEITLRSTSTADTDLYVRFNRDVALEGGRPVSDFRSEGNDSNEQVVISGSQLQSGTYFIAFGLFTTGVQVQATITATVTTGTAPPPPPPATGGALTSGQARNFSLPAVNTPTLFNGANGFTIAVPQGATRLEVTLRTTTANADVDLYLSFGQDVTIESGRPNAEFRSEGLDGNEQIVLTGSQVRAGTYFIAFGLFTTGVAVEASVTANVSSTPAQQSNALTSGQPRNISLGPVNTPTLFNGANGFTINVPQGANRLEITLRTQESADVDIYARFGQDVALESGRVVADARSEGPDGNEQIVISGSALRAGTYFIGFGLFTTGVTVQSTITASVGSTVTPPVTTGAVTLTSGSPATFRIGPVNSPTLFSGNRGFRIQVPAGASRLDIALSTTSPAGADVDLYARFGTDVGVAEGRVVADERSESLLGTERITITAASNPPLRSGTYFIALGLFTTGVEASGTVTATVTTGGQTTQPTAPTEMTSGVPAKFSLPVTTTPTLYRGNFSFFINVPEGASRLRVQLKSDVPTVDTDLYVRHGSDNDVDAEGNVIADYASTSLFADETITVDTLSSPILRPGTHYISVAVFTTGLPVTGTITATVERSAVTGVGVGAVLQSGVPASFTLPRVSAPTLFTGQDGFQITAPANVTKLEIVVRTDRNATDVDLHVRHGLPPAVGTGGLITADHSSAGETGAEQVTILPTSRPPLRPGTYHIALALFSVDTPATGTVTATITTGATTTFHDDEGGKLQDKPEIIIRTEPLTPLVKDGLLPKPGLYGKSGNSLDPKKRVARIEEQ
jgi:hypothetical protein